MGRSSSSSCLSFVACGKESPENDEMEEVEEMKAHQDKRRWSFRKRSPRHRVLTNTVPSDLPPSAGNKGSPEPSGNDFAGQANICGLAKISIPRETDDIFPLSPVALRPVAACSDPAGNIRDFASRVPESVVIVIQTAVRGCLARGDLNKLKNIIKLQGAVRGHLVRRQAAGALRCVQAIVRMQALVRGHRVRSSENGLAIQQKLDQMRRTDGRRVNKLENQEYCVESNSLCRPADKVFGSAFACQILESTSMPKPACIICDSTEPSSGWRWLDRWMTLSEKRYPGSWNTQLVPDQLEPTEKFDFVDEVDASNGTAISHGLEFLKSKDEKSDEDSMIHLEGDEDLITIDASGFTFRSCHSVDVSGECTNTRCNLENPKAAAKGSDFKPTSSEQIRTSFQSMLDSLSSQSHSALHHAAPDSVPFPPITESIPSPPKTEVDVPNHSMKVSVAQHQQAEGKKAVSMKATNSAFAAVQSKFEELSSMSALGRMSTSNNYGVPAEPRLGAISPRNSCVKTMEVSQADDTASCNQRFQKGTSECGTEISISSTLDSPDISEAECGELEHVSGALDNKCSEEHETAMHKLRSNQSIEESLSISKSPSVVEEPKVVLMTSADSPSPMQYDSAESGNPIFHRELCTGAIQQMGGSSQEGSPTSRATVQESQGTPSNQVSSGTRKGKADSNKSISKRISSSATKGSPSSDDHDPMEQNTAEHLARGPKDQRHRNSLGSIKPGHIDVEQRSSLPSYMQATESARAKALASQSPKSSPNALDKDGYLKKRHSLPISNGKQDSPRIPQPLSQAQPGAKGSNEHPPKEREWRR